ncbi:MAG: hypothetical protein QXX09_03615 [Candidatus Methanomethylicia archaeon]
MLNLNPTLLYNVLTMESITLILSSISMMDGGEGIFLWVSQYITLDTNLPTSPIV